MIVKKNYAKIELIFLFILFTVVSYVIYSFFCISFPKFNFDSQIPLTQTFAASNSLLPYRDIYFPYGIIFYLKDDSLLFGAIYILLLPLLFVSFLLFLKKLWRNSIYAYISFLFLVYFVIKFPGFQTFMRYGVIAAVGLLFSYIFSKKPYIAHFVSFLNGLLIGVIFSLVHDQGIYAFILCLLLLIFNPLIRMGINQLRKWKYYINLFYGIIALLVGVFFGFLPFLAYLVYHKIFFNFVQFLLHLSDFPIYAKTPFIPYSSTADNLFTFSILFLAIFFIFYKILHTKKFSLSFYLILIFTIILVLLEQKSLVRSLDTIITFFSFMIFVGLSYECKIFLRKMGLSDLKILVCYTLLIIIIVFKLNLHSFGFSIYTLNKTTADQNSSCLTRNLNRFLITNKKYEDVEKNIKRNPKFSGKIFSYLSDPIFYNLFNQKPPYYFTIFEATPLYAQKENIKYIVENKISHIIYNMDILQLQDNVPDYARGGLFFKYMLNNFKIKENIKNLLIFEKKDNGNDFFEDGNLRKLFLFQHYLLNINLGAIPKSEGIYKGKNMYIKNDLIISGNSFAINNFLKKNTIKTSGKILVLISKNYKKNIKTTTITMKTNDAKITTVAFHRCDINKPCVINFSNLPLFYKERVLKEIALDESFEGRIDLINNRGEFGLW